MEFKVEHKEKNKAIFTIEIPYDKFEEGIRKSYQKNAKYFKIPGFRPGKAPRNIIEKYYGEEVFYEDAVNFILNETYPEVAEKSNLEIVSNPEIDVVQLEKGKPFIYTAEVYLKPDFELGEYKGIEVTKREYLVSEEEIEHELEHLREENARYVPVDDREVQNGDYVTIDFEGFVDGKSIENGKATDYEIQIGSNTFIPGFEEKLIGMKKDEEREIEVKFPDDYNAAHLAGKDAKFKVLVKGIKYKELPQLDDEFAKDVSEFETLEELKESIRKKLQEQKDAKAKDEILSELMDKISEKTQIDIPEPMIQNQINHYVNESERTMRYFGYTLDSYLKMTNKTIEEYKESFRERALKAVKNNLILEKIGKVENLQIDEMDIQKEIDNLAKSYKMDVEKFKENLKDDDIEYIKEGIIINKALELIYQNAKFVESEKAQ